MKKKVFEENLSKLLVECLRHQRMDFDALGRVRWVWSDKPVEIEDDPEVKKLLEAHAKNAMAQTSFAPNLLRGRL